MQNYRIYIYKYLQTKFYNKNLLFETLLSWLDEHNCTNIAQACTLTDKHFLEAATGPGVLQGGGRRPVQEVQDAMWTDMCPWIRIILFQIIRTSQHDGAQT